VQYTSSPRQPRGISEANRARLSLLHARLQGPFTPEQAARVLGVDAVSARRLLSYLAERGWLSRVRRGLYTTVPLQASQPSEWRADPWVVAASTFTPGYVGGWSACEHWGLTEQIFQDVVVVTSRPSRGRSRTIQGTTYRVKTLAPGMLFGTRSVWREGVRVQVSDPSRTLVDVLDDPSLGGGMRHIAGVVAAYFGSELRDEHALLTYIERRGNGAIYKRLGYLLEALVPGAPDVVEACLGRLTAGNAVLDPAIRLKGRLSKRWRLWVNVVVSAAEPS
jgi:predicted transcriptional regulator of viral defense system